MRVKFLDQAKADLVEHNEYTREIGGAGLANKMLARMKASVVALRDNPEVAQPYELAPDIRRLVVAQGAFLVFYRVRVDVEVLHIRRAERRPVSVQELEHLGEDSQA